MEDLKNKVSETKKKINEAKLSQSFKDNLKIMMDKEYYKTNENSKVKLIENKNSEFKGTKLRFLYPKKVAAIFLCLIIFSSFVFAGDWENIFAKIFYNMDSSMSLAIEDGYVQNIDMDYVESNGVKIKVDYLLFDEKSLYIAFNVNVEKEFDDVFFNDFIIKDVNDEVIYDCENSNTDIIFKRERKRIDNNTIMLLDKIENINTIFENMEKTRIEISCIEIKSSEKSELISGEWNFNLDIEKGNNNYNIENIDGYFVNTQKLINEYNAKVENYRLKVSVELKDILNKDIQANKNNIYLEDKLGNKYYASDNFIIYNNKLTFLIKLPRQIDLYKSKLKIKYCEDQKDELILYFKNTNG